MEDPPSPPITLTATYRERASRPSKSCINMASSILGLTIQTTESLKNKGFSSRWVAIPQHSFMLVVVTRSESLNLRAAIGATKLASMLVSLDDTMVLTFYIGVAFSFIQVAVQRSLTG
ncbi:hypothetical protein VPH35_092341 [Triticum aestivum]